MYAEWKIEDSVGPSGFRRPNVFALGVRLDLGLPEMQRNDAPPLRFPESESPSREIGEATQQADPAPRGEARPLMTDGSRGTLEVASSGTENGG